MAVVHCATVPRVDTKQALATVDLVAFGSCSHQDDPMPIWDVIASHSPDVFLFIGDNVYGDVSSDDPQMPELRAAYAKLGQRTEFQRFRRAVPILPTWDDHDYGLNDAGGDFKLHGESKALFAEFWDIKADDPRMQRRGLYYAETRGAPGRRLQLILLDTRSFRSALKPTDQRNAKGKERYLPSDDTRRTVLGEEQWAWLEKELRKSADVRILISSYQVLAEDHGWESWHLLPHERVRLLKLIESTKANGVVILSGDRHVGALYRSDAGQVPIYELTSSSLNRAIPGKKAYDPGAPQIGPVYVEENFGLVRIDWSARQLTLELRNLKNEAIIMQTVPFQSQ